MADTIFKEKRRAGSEVRVCLFCKGTLGLSEPMSNVEANSWAREAVARYPGLRYCIIADREPAVIPTVAGVFV